MMRKIFSMLLLCAAVVLASCSKDDPAPESVAVAFSTLTANGSATETTTALTLTFDKVIEGLTAESITLTAGETGAVKGALTAKSNGVYELVVSGIAKAGDVTVAVAKAGYTITPASKTIAVKYVDPVIAVAFSSLTANGSATETTTLLTLTFDKVIEGLTAESITLTAGETGAVKGALTAKENGVYELAVSDIVKGGEITIAVAKTGYTITPAENTVTVNSYIAPSVSNFYYDDNTYSTTLNTDKTCIGIVYEVNADGKSGKIVGLKEFRDRWGLTDSFESLRPSIGQSLLSTTDGATATKNMIAYHKEKANFKSAYKTFEWIYTTINGGSLDGRWYLPAIDELMALYTAWNGDATGVANAEARAAFNAQLTAVDGDVFASDSYWSTTEVDRDFARTVFFQNGGEDDMAGKKTRRTRARVISTFTIL